MERADPGVRRLERRPLAPYRGEDPKEACMTALLHHDSLADHLTGATGIFAVLLIVAVLLGIFAYIRR